MPPLPSPTAPPLAQARPAPAAPSPTNLASSASRPRSGCERKAENGDIPAALEAAVASVAVVVPGRAALLASVADRGRRSECRSRMRGWHPGVGNRRIAGILAAENIGTAIRGIEQAGTSRSAVA